MERPYLPTTTLMPNNFDTELDSVDPGECLHSMIISNHIIQKKCIISSAGPRGRASGATAEGPCGGGAQAQIYKSPDPIVH